MKFEELNIIAPLLKAIQNEGYEEPTPIQEQAIPVLLAGRDILGSAQTGTGKTAAFAVPIIQGIFLAKDKSTERRKIQALVLAPTRELAEQIKDSFRSYSKGLGTKADVIYGGVSQKSQVASIHKGLDVLIATPGRLLDLMNQKIVDISHIKYFVLDEADRMLDMGFIYDVNRIIAHIPMQRQTMLFSATVPQEITKLANSLLSNPVRIEVTPPETTLEMIEQSLYHVTKKDKTNLLIDLLVNPKMVSVLVFTRTKHGANKLVKELLSFGVKADAIHGNKSQNKRQQALSDFKHKKLRVLVATDIAARGIDIDELSHVVNYDLPETPETYIHRMGRTGRAGLSGAAFSFCSAEEGHLLKSIEKHIHMSIPLVNHHPFSSNFTGLILTKPPGPKPQTKRGPQHKNHRLESTDRKKKTFSATERPRSKEDIRYTDRPKKKTQNQIEVPLKKSDLSTQQDDRFVAYKPKSKSSKKDIQVNMDGSKKKFYDSYDRFKEKNNFKESRSK